MEKNGIQPAAIASVAEFTAALRALKSRSGLTLRQLETRAAARGDALARSTIADLLRRHTLPRPELLAAFVRACGAESQLPEWIQAHERLAYRAAAATSAAPSATQDGATGALPTEPGAARPRLGRMLGATGVRRRHLVVATAAVLAVAVGVGVLLANGPTGKPAASPPSASAIATTEFLDVLHIPSAGSWARLHPAQTPDFCLTEGKDRSERYGSAVAVQASCTRPGPRTFLQPVGEDLADIKWEHPQTLQMGCLTIRSDSPAEGFLEPENDCLLDKEAQLFRIERFSPTSEGYRIRRAHTTFCVGMYHGETAAGVEAVQQTCDDKPAQRFLIDLIPQPTAHE